MRIYMAGVLKPVIGWAQLSSLNLNDRLISYFICREHTVNPDEEFRYFCESGDAQPYKAARKYNNIWQSPVYKRHRKLRLAHRVEELSPNTNLHTFTTHQRVNVMLDSGVFAVWKRGSKVNIDEYIAFVHNNLGYIEVCVNMDMIPSKFGQGRTSAQVAESAKVSRENQLYMKSNGLKPLPVFHRGEEFIWLKKMLDDGEEYIGISPKAADSDAVSWLDKVFTLLTTDDGMPRVRIHGMGITATQVLFRYPWATADSTTWSNASSMGCILYPKHIGRTVRYDLPPMLIYFSDQSTKKSIAAFSALSPLQQKAILDYLEEAGVSQYQLRYDYLARAKATGLFFKRVLKELEIERPFKFRLANISWMGE
jgi:hypothetical protein